MPLYEFECQACGQITEMLMKISDPQPDLCSCEKKGSLRKKMSRTSFVLKGQGWYETDFKTKPAKKEPKNKNEQASSKPASSPKADSTTTAP